MRLDKSTAVDRGAAATALQCLQWDSLSRACRKVLSAGPLCAVISGCFMVCGSAWKTGSAPRERPMTNLCRGQNKRKPTFVLASLSQTPARYFYFLLVRIRALCVTRQDTVRLYRLYRSVIQLCNKMCRINV